MSETSKIPRDVQDGIRDVMDKKVKLSLKLLVKMEIKGDKTENKVLAFTPCRVFVLNAKVPSKLEHSFHFLDIQSIESKKSHQLALTIDGKVYAFQALETSTEEMDHVITHIGMSLKYIFPSFPLERLIVKIDVQPPERLKVMNDLIQSIESKAVGPCGGYTKMYQCMCDYHGSPLREEVEWDVDTIYLSLDSKEFRLQDFDHLLPRDLVPIIAALEHNTWFKALNASNVKLCHEACSELIRVMKRNAVIEEVNLSNTGIKSDFIQKFALALISNSATQLSSLDVSNNLLEDRGINHLLGALKHLPCGLTTFDMSRTGVSTRCLNKVGEILSQAPNVMASLMTIKINDNGLKGEDLPLFYNCLAQPNAITYLDVSSTDCALDALCDPLLRGCPSLTTLRASGTTFTHKKSRDVQIPLSWKQLFISACCLELVDLSNCRLPPDVLKEMLLGISANRNMKGVYVDISSNELGPAGAAVLAPCISVMKGVTGLDISNNGFDVELKSLLPELAKNPHIKQLSLGRNFVNIKPKFRADVMAGLALLLQEENSGLESLSLADSKLKGETAYVLNALGSNDTLMEIDISGNGIGDIGARMLAKALMINSKLNKVVWDKNNVSVQGFEDVAEALQKNLTLKKMPYPITDAAAALRLFPDRTEAALQKIESFLQRNHSPRRFDPDQAYRLQQGFLISSTQQMVDRLVVKVEDTINALQSTSSAESHAHEVESAQKLIADANNSRQLLPSLQDIALKSQAEGNPVDEHLQAMANSLRKAIEQQME
ncbi:leucine-rich repeat-containing protein 16a, partial [Plakobranchus ocellatus]